MSYLLNLDNIDLSFNILCDDILPILAKLKNLKQSLYTKTN